jgi:AcrR family transcriptional regulator
VAISAPAAAARKRRSRPAASTEKRILDVAIREFARKGFAGARVEEISNRAGVNKQLVYYYFKSKEALYIAALEAMAKISLTAQEQMRKRMEEEGYGNAVIRNATVRERKRWQLFRRLWAWEALERGHEDIVNGEERRESWQRWIGLVADAQKRGELDDRVDPDMLQLAIEAILNYPHVLPQNTRLITGSEPMDEVFIERHLELLRWFFELMRPRPEPERDPR